MNIVILSYCTITSKKGETSQATVKNCVNHDSPTISRTTWNKPRFIFARKMNKAFPKSSESTLSTEGVSVRFRSSSTCSFSQVYVYILSVASLYSSFHNHKSCCSSGLPILVRCFQSFFGLTTPERPPSSALKLPSQLVSTSWF